MSNDWGLDEDKFYSLEETRTLIETAKKLRLSKRFEAIRNWFLIEFDLNTGLRVEELADLKHGDLYVSLGKSHVEVRAGKGNKRRIVMISERLRHSCEYYCNQKQTRGLSVEKNSHVFTKRNGQSLTTRALQKSFTQCARLAGLCETNIHRLRHTYATYLAETKVPLRFVQKQLGHSSIKTTEQYMGVSREHIKLSLNKLHNLFGK